MVATVVVSFFVLVTLLTLAIYYGTQYAGRVMGNRVNAMHRAAEYILDTAKVPQEWMTPLPDDRTREEKYKGQQKQKAIKKLRKLLSYFETTPCFSDAESREYVLGELRRIEQAWIQADWDEMADAKNTACP